MFHDIQLTRTSDEVERLAGLCQMILGDQFKPDDAIQAEPTDVIHSRDIASDSLASRIIKAPILFIEELAERTRDLILFGLKTIRLCLVDDLVGFAKPKGIGELGEE